MVKVPTHLSYACLRQIKRKIMNFNICAPDKHVWEHKNKVKCVGVAPGDIPAIKRCKVCKISELYNMAKEKIK